jgi:hypothetical protein
MFRESPALAYKRFVSGELPPDPPSKSMILGSLANYLLLLPDRLHEVRVVDVQARNAKTFKDEFALHEDQMVVTLPEWEAAEAIAGAVLRPESEGAEVAHDLLLGGDGHPEFAHQWDDDSGVPLKCMIDRLRLINGLPCLLELKTTKDPEPDAFRRDFENYDYHVQAAHNRRGIRHVLGGAIPPVIVVVVRNEEPYEVAMPHQVSEWLLTEGDKQLARDLASLSKKLRGEEPWCAEWQKAPISGQLPVLEPSWWMQKRMLD